LQLQLAHLEVDVAVNDCRVAIGEVQATCDRTCWAATPSPPPQEQRLRPLREPNHR
jgi:hypothetical protein